MKIHPIITNNSLQNIFYIVEYGNKEALVIDPSDTNLTQDFLEKHDLKLNKIFITHEHYDHYDGVEGLGCKEIYISEIAAKNIPISVTHTFGDEDIIFSCDEFTLKARSTPGHAEGHMIFELSEQDKVTIIFSGDALFQGGVGHTRNGSNEDLYNSIQKFQDYDDNVMIYSGHDYIENNCHFLKKHTPENSEDIDTFLERRQEGVFFTTLGEERVYNPFLSTSKQEFIRLRNLRNSW